MRLFCEQGPRNDFQGNLDVKIYNFCYDFSLNYQTNYELKDIATKIRLKS